MRTLKTLKPDQKGTKDLLTRYGQHLLLVRYRYDEDARERVKTVELVVERRSDSADVRRTESQRSASRARAARKRRVALRIGWQKRDLQRRLRTAGGRWDSVKRVWIVGRDVAERLGFAGPGGRGRWIDVGAGWIDLVTAVVDRCRRWVDRSRHRCLHVGTTCPVKQTVGRTR